MPKRPKKVAAGWYVGGGLAFLLTGVPPGLLNNPWIRGTLCVLGVICLFGAAYEWWFRKDDQSPAAPEVTSVQITPKLVAGENRSMMIDPTDVSMNAGKPEDALLAAMAEFEYDPSLARGPRVVVRAKLTFEKQAHTHQGGGRVVRVGSGYWRDTTKNQAMFSPGVRHELIVAIEHRGRVTAVQDERSDRSELRPTLSDLGHLATPAPHVVQIDLILLDETSHERLGVNSFRYLLNMGEFYLYLTPLEA